jgi:hypothetical protein
LVEGDELIILKDNELFHLLDLSLCLLLLQFVALHQIHQGVDVVRASLLQVRDDRLCQSHLLSLLFQLQGQLLGIVDQAFQVLGISLLSGVQSLIVHSYLLVSKVSVIELLLGELHKISLVLDLVLLVADLV